MRPPLLLVVAVAQTCCALRSWSRDSPTRRALEKSWTKDPARRALHRLERIDVDTMLNNNRIMTNYVKCFVGKGACSPEARDFRKLIPRLTATACGDCTPNQSKIIKKVFLFMYTQRNSDWLKLQEMFDPKHKFEKKICDFMGVQNEKTKT